MSVPFGNRIFPASPFRRVRVHPSLVSVFRACSEPAHFWHEQSALISWNRPPSLANTLDKSRAPHFYRWFVDGKE
jgi:hypothetical protein